MRQKSGDKTSKTGVVHDFVHDGQYQSWITDVSRRFRSSQIKAAMKVNDEMLRFYWTLGRDISRLSENAVYGSGLYKQISADLIKLLPEVKSFSVTNLKYMKYFYELYSTEQNRQQIIDDSVVPTRQQLVDDFVGIKMECGGSQDIFQIPWGHHVVIIDKCKNHRDKALFFVRKTLENNWSRAVLLNFLDENRGRTCR